MVRDKLLEFSEFQFLARRSVVDIQCMGIEQCQLQQIKNCFLCPPVCPSGESIIIDHLIKKIHATHVVDVFSDDCGPLHNFLFVDISSLPLDLPPVEEFFCVNAECRGHDVYQPDVLPADDEGVILPAVYHVPTAHLLRGCLIFQFQGCPASQPESATAMGFFLIQLFSKGHGIIEVIHKDVIAFPQVTPQQIEHNVVQCVSYATVHNTVEDVASFGLAQKIKFYAVANWFLGVIHTNGESPPPFQHALVDG